MFAESLGIALWLAASGSTPTMSVDESADTTEIVNLLINENLASESEAPDGGYLVVVAETLAVCLPETEDPQERAFSLAAMLEQHCASLDVPDSLRRDLLCQQEGGMLPTSRFENGEVVLASQITAIFSGDILRGWDDFYRTFPGSRGLLEFTAPAFSPDGSHALIYVSHSCGGLCGTGFLIYLSRGSDGHWQMTKRSMLWIS